MMKLPVAGLIVMMNDTISAPAAAAASVHDPLTMSSAAKTSPATPTSSAVLAAELYDHHSAEVGDDVWAKLSDHELATRSRGLRPLTGQPAVGGVLHSLRSLRPYG